VFSGILKYLRSHLIDALAGILKLSNSEWIADKFHIRWVLSHPATWTDNGQHFLRVAAKQVVNNKKKIYNTVGRSPKSNQK
jgi:hypothetical protein